MTTWPYPGDSPTTRAKRVALAYREQLRQAAPGRCELLDHSMRDYGQHWVITRPVTVEPDAWVDAKHAAEIAAMSLSTLRGLRLAGRITGRCRSARRWEYRVADVMALSTMPRRRGGKGETEGAALPGQSQRGHRRVDAHTTDRPGASTTGNAVRLPVDGDGKGPHPDGT